MAHCIRRSSEEECPCILQRVLKIARWSFPFQKPKKSHKDASDRKQITSEWIDLFSVGPSDTHKSRWGKSLPNQFRFSPSAPRYAFDYSGSSKTQACFFFEFHPPVVFQNSAQFLELLCFVLQRAESKLDLENEHLRNKKKRHCPSNFQIIACSARFWQLRVQTF